MLCPADVLQLSDEECEPLPNDRGRGSNEAAVPDIHDLSDDETCPPPPPISSSSGHRQRAAVKRKGSQTRASTPSLEQIRRRTNAVLCSKCRCAKRRGHGHNCFEPFRNKLDELCNLQLQRRQMHKEDMDREVRLAFQLFGGVKLDTYVYIYI